MIIANRCPACDSTNFNNSQMGILAPFVAARTGIDGSNIKSCVCNVCALRFSSIRFDDNEAALLYEDYRGPSYNEQRNRYEPGYIEQYAHINDTRPYMKSVENFILAYSKKMPKSILDIGGNDGGNTPFANEVEYFEVMEVGDKEPITKFDLVVMAHVLEHVSWPRETVALARRHLNKDGVIYAEIPFEPFESYTWHEHITQYHHEQSIRMLFDNKVIELQRVRTEINEIWIVLSK